MTQTWAFLRKNIDIFIAALLLAALGAFLLSLENPISIDDGPRHFTYARLTMERGISGMRGWREFLYRGPMSTVDLDPWFLADLSYAPFTRFSIETGLHLYTLFTTACVVGSFLLLLRSLGVPPSGRALLLAPLLFGDFQFAYRLMIARPFPLMTAFSLVLLWALLERRFVVVACTFALAVLFSHLFTLLLPFALAGFLHALYRKKYSDGCWIVLSMIIGIISAFLIHPHTLAYLRYLILIFLKIPFLKSLPVSREMTLGVMTDMLPFLSAAGLIGVLLSIAVLKKRWRSDRTGEEKIQLLCITAALLLPGYLFWMRLIDHLWPVTLALPGAVAAAFPGIMAEARMIFLPRRMPSFLPTLTLLIACAIPGHALLRGISVRDPYLSLDPIRAALADIPPGSRVMNLEWDRFPPFMAVRPDLAFARGIDGSFDFFENPASGNLLLRSGDALLMENEHERTEWLRALLRQIPAPYFVLSHRLHPGLFEALTESPSPPFLEPFSGNEDTMVYRVIAGAL